MLQYDYLIDSSHIQTAEVILTTPPERWQKFNNGNSNFGTKTYPVWLKFKVLKTDPKPYYIKLKNSSDYSKLSLYAFKADSLLSEAHTGVAARPSPEAYLHTERILSLGYQSCTDTLTYLFMLRTDYSMQVGIQIFRDEALVSHNHLYDLGQGVYYGIVLVMFLYNICIFLVTRERIYLWYSITVISAAINFSILIGQFFEFVLPSYAAFTSQYIIAMIAFCSMAVPVFAYQFLNVRHYLPRFYYSLAVILACYLLIIVCNLLHLPISFTKGLLELVAAISILTILGIGIYIRWRGYKPANFFLLAWSTYLAAVMIFVLQDANLISSNVWTFYSAQIGSGLEMVLLAFGVANKINTYKQEKSIAQKAAFEALNEQKAAIKAQNEVLEKKVMERTQEISNANEELAQTVDELNRQRFLLAEKNKILTAGISSAKIIQEAMLPSEGHISRFFDQHFELFLPKDIVSGDFYWLRKKNDYLYIAVADCTGHGVHGAFISLLGSKLLDDVLAHQQTDGQVADMLENLHQRILTQFRQRETHNNDGMDIALCCIDLKRNHFSFAGAHSSLFIVESGLITEIRGSARHIGGARRENKVNKAFEQHHLNIGTDTAIYLSTDGYYHQSRAGDDLKMNKLVFKEILLKATAIPFFERKKYLKSSLETWANGAPQKDDILVVGFSLKSIAKAEKVEQI